MTWDELRQCPASGIAVGAHGHSHRVLSTLSPEEQREELQASKELIERRIGARVRSLAYPVGGREHFTPTTKALAEELGYSLAFSFQGPACLNRWETIDRLDVRRLPPASTVAMTAAMAALPSVFVPGPHPWPFVPSQAPTGA
jgi:peptidoglycan/xylan/chitin deacetylase (PgdA/CDA1 family)